MNQIVGCKEGVLDKIEFAITNVLLAEDDVVVNHAPWCHP